MAYIPLLSHAGIAIEYSKLQIFVVVEIQTKVDCWERLWTARLSIWLASHLIGLRRLIELIRRGFCYGCENVKRLTCEDGSKQPTSTNRMCLAKVAERCFCVETAAAHFLFVGERREE
jgi:hypothetical protein